MLPADCLKMLYFGFVHLDVLYGVEIYINTFTSYLDKVIKLNNKLLRIVQQKNTDTVGILSFLLITVHYLLPNCTVSKSFVLYTNLFTIKIYCQEFIIIILLRHSKHKKQK